MFKKGDIVKLSKGALEELYRWSGEKRQQRAKQMRFEVLGQKHNDPDCISLLRLPNKISRCIYHRDFLELAER